MMSMSRPGRCALALVASIPLSRLYVRSGMRLRSPRSNSIPLAPAATGLLIIAHHSLERKLLPPPRQEGRPEAPFRQSLSREAGIDQLTKWHYLRQRRLGTERGVTRSVHSRIEAHLPRL